MNKYLLTDFSKKRWEGINFDSVIEAFEKIKNNKIYGCIGEYDSNKISHIIDNLSIEDYKIYGDVTFLDKEFIYDKYLYKFNIYCMGRQSINGNIFIDDINTWCIIENDINDIDVNDLEFDF